MFFENDFCHITTTETEGEGIFREGIFQLLLVEAEKSS